MQDWVVPLAASPFIGSLLGVLIRRLPEGRPVILARSACDSCAKRLGPAELVPLISFVVQRGRCRGCGAAIARMHVAVELAAVLVAIVVTLTTEGAEDIWAGCALGWTLLALAWIDMDSLLLPDALTLPLIVIGLTVAWLLEPWLLTNRAIGAIAGYAAFRAVEVGYRRLRGRDGLGQGDAKVLAAGGAWLGWAALPWVVVLAALCGLAAAGVMALVGRTIGRETVLPFGPPLAIAIWLLWLAQHMDWQ